MNIAELLHLEWRAPLWWWIALTPLIFSLLAAWRKPTWNRYADLHLQPWAVQQSVPMQHGKLGTIATWLFWLLLACALAGPRLPLDTPDARQTRHDMDVLVVLDVSPSMAAVDIAPNRLARAKLKLQDLIASMHGERIGLVVYSGEAGLLLPLTRDTQAFTDTLALANESLFEDKGSQLAAALNLARHTFADTGRSRAVLLLTDAEASSLSGDAGIATVNAARALKTAGIPLSVLMLASDAGAPIPLADGGTLMQDGATVISRPDVAGYQTLAEMTGGNSARVSDDKHDLTALYDHGILTLASSKDVRDKARAWREFFPYPLALGLMLLLASQLRFTRRSVLLVATLAASGAAQADDGAWRDAYQAYQRGQYLLAQQAYHQVTGFSARMGEGAAAYRRKDYTYATQQFTLALLQARSTNQRADALFNLGDSYFYAGNPIAAADAFDGVLRYRPNDQRAKENLGRARGKLMLRNNQLVQKDGIHGRRGRGLGDGEADTESPLGMAPDKDEKRPLVNLNGFDAADARRLGSDTQATQSDLDAARRAALKKLDLLKDQRAETFKQVLKQDATRNPPPGMPPW
jgi:Ca-activated chloride channel family protein